MRVQVPPSALEDHEEDGETGRPFFLMNMPDRHKPQLLSQREVYCIRVAAMFATGQRDDSMKIVERGIRREKIPVRMFAELFVHLSLLLGFPAMLDGLGRLRDLAQPDKSPAALPKEREADLLRRGRKYFRKIYGKATERLLANLGELHVIVPTIILRDAYGRIIGRPGLKLRERELVNVVVLMIQQLDRQLYSHIRGALRIGVAPKSLRSVIILAARTTGSDRHPALEMLTSLTSSKNPAR